MDVCQNMVYLFYVAMLIKVSSATIEQIELGVIKKVQDM